MPHSNLAIRPGFQSQRLARRNFLQGSTYPVTIRHRGYDLPREFRLRPRNTSLVAAAEAYSKWTHKGERLKYVQDVYFTHPKAVSERMFTPDQKVVAFLHDAVENRVSEVLGKFDPFTDDISLYAQAEDIVIRQTLKEITDYFRNCGHSDIDHIINDIDQLTKRVTDQDYGAYIDRLIAKGSMTAIMVKVADIEDNSLPERNRPTSAQTDKDVKRLKRYADALDSIANSSLHFMLRPRRQDRPDPRNDDRARSKDIRRAMRRWQPGW